MAIIRAPGGTSDLANNLLRFFMQREQLEQQKEAQKLQERQLEMQEEQAAREAEQAAAAQKAAQTTLGLLAQNDPQAAQMLQQAAPPQAQRTVGPQTAPMTPNLTPGQAQPIEVTEPLRQEVDPSRIPGAQAQALVGQIQGLRESQSLVEQREASTEAAQAQTRATMQSIEHAERLFEPELTNLRAQTRRAETAADLDEAQIAELQRREARETREFAANRATEQQQIFAQLAPVLGPGMASRTVFGTSAPPSREELIAQESQFISQATAFADAQENPEEALTRLHEDRQRTQVAQRLGIPAETQQALDAAVERSEGDPQAAYEFAKEAAGEPGAVISEADLPVVASYLTVRFPDFEIPEEDAGFLRQLLESAQAAPEASGGRELLRETQGFSGVGGGGFR